MFWCLCLQHLVRFCSFCLLSGLGLGCGLDKNMLLFCLFVVLSTDVIRIVAFLGVVFDGYEELSVCNDQCCLSCLLAGCCQNFSIAIFSENGSVIKVTRLHSVTCTPHRALPVHTTFSDLAISRSYQCQALSDSV